MQDTPDSPRSVPNPKRPHSYFTILPPLFSPSLFLSSSFSFSTLPSRPRADHHARSAALDEVTTPPHRRSSPFASPVPDPSSHAPPLSLSAPGEVADGERRAGWPTARGGRRRAAHRGRIWRAVPPPLFLHRRYCRSSPSHLRRLIWCAASLSLFAPPPASLPVLPASSVTAAPPPQQSPPPPPRQSSPPPAPPPARPRGEQKRERGERGERGIWCWSSGVHRSLSPQTRRSTSSLSQKRATDALSPRG